MILECGGHAAALEWFHSGGMAAALQGTIRPVLRPFLLLLLPLIALPLHAVEIRRLTAPVVIDGNVSPEEWGGASKVEQFYEINPGDNIAPKVHTTAYLAYDDRFFYAAFVLDDPNPSAIRAPYADRDSIAESTDYAGVILNPSGDRKTGIEFLATPRGVQFDAINSDATGEDAAPDFYWDAAARITRSGWELEIRIPFSSLRYSPGEERNWGVLLYRNYPRDRRYQIMSTPIPRDSSCFICHSMPLLGLAGLPSSSHLIVAPYTTLAQDRVPSVRGVDIRSGADAKWTPNAHVAIDATLNPDFSQIESDVAAITSNQRFAVFFPEKRPFFLEGKDLFATPLQPVYTREINSPRWGGRVTGTSGATAYTVLVADDRGGGAVIIPGPNSSSLAFADFESRNLIGRVRHDFGTSFASFLVTDREIAGGGHNRVFGPDGLLQLTHDTFRAQFLVSDSTTPNRPDLATEWNGQHLASHAFQADWNHKTEHVDWYTSITDRGDQFRADLGFLPQVGTREAFGNGGYTWRPTRGFFSRIRPFVEADYTGEQEGPLVYRFYAPGIEVDGRWASNASVSYSFDKVRAGVRTIERGVLHVDLFASPSRFLQSIELHSQTGSDIDFENSRPATGVGINGQVQIRPTDHLELAANGAYKTLNVLGGQRLFVARVERLKATYNFTAHSFLRLVGQIARTDRNPALYLDSATLRDGTRSLSGLYAYKVNWQTVLYAGFGNVDELTTTNAYVPSAKQLFVKVSYAWQR